MLMCYDLQAPSSYRTKGNLETVEQIQNSAYPVTGCPQAHDTYGTLNHALVGLFRTSNASIFRLAVVGT